MSVNKTFGTVLVLLAGLAVELPLLAQPTPTARYRVTYQATWSSASHPYQFPNNAHFSPLIGGVHDGTTTFWSNGALASDGIEEMAERGGTQLLTEEIETQIALGAAREVITGDNVDSPGSVSTEFTASLEHPLVSLVTMVAPSPDWFVGVDDLSLLRDDAWVPKRVVPLFAWDSGTDDGPIYRSPDDDTVPPQPIHQLTTRPFDTGLVLGTFVFERLDGPPGPGLLLGGRFRVEALFGSDDSGNFAFAQPQPASNDSGLFWFFRPENLELFVKVLDACTLNNRIWVFAAGLTNRAVELRVTDTQTGLSKTYVNPANTAFAPIQDTGALAACPP